jgi:hypothetical protein
MNIKRLILDVFFCIGRAIFSINDERRNLAPRPNRVRKLLALNSPIAVIPDRQADSAAMSRKTQDVFRPPASYTMLQPLEQSLRFIPFRKVFLFLQ